MNQLRTVLLAIGLANKYSNMHEDYVIIMHVLPTSHVYACSCTYVQHYIHKLVFSLIESLPNSFLVYTNLSYKCTLYVHLIIIAR